MCASTRPTITISAARSTGRVSARVERASQIILRNSASLASGPTLLFNPPPDSLFRELAAQVSGVACWCQDFGDFQRLRGQQAKVEFGVFPPAETLPAQVILFQPREKDRLEMILHFLAAGLPAGGRVWLVGENQAGIKSAAQKLDRYFDSVVKLDAARHCVLYSAESAHPAAAFSLADYQQKWLLSCATGELRMVSLPGTFAHGRLDKGTALLLQCVRGLQGPNRPSGSVLDFGCGVGVIGISLLRDKPALNLTLLDSSALSLECARLSLQANTLEAGVIAADGLDSLERKFDWIVSNPPFHRGISTQLETARHFFARAPEVLSNQGKMLIVCNRHLPYERFLAERFDSVEPLEKRNDYKVLLATRRKS